MIMQCPKCGLAFDDEFRTTLCPHGTFAVNDGANNFAHDTTSYLGKPEDARETVHQYVPSEADLEWKDRVIDGKVAVKPLALSPKTLADRLDDAAGKFAADYGYNVVIDLKEAAALLRREPVGWRTPKGDGKGHFFIESIAIILEAERKHFSPVYDLSKKDDK